MIINAGLSRMARTAKSPKQFDLTDHERSKPCTGPRGKTSPEIAQILDVSWRTVDFNIDNARMTLTAATRPHEAVTAAA